MNNKYSKLLVVILFTGFLLRLWGIWNVDTTDEYNEVLEALRICSGHLNYERWLKRVYCYVLSIEYGIYYLTGWAFHIFTSPMDFASKIVRNMEPLFLIGRITSVFFGSISIFLLYKVGEKVHSKSVGLLAALFFTFYPTHVELCQSARLEATVGLLVLLSFYFILRVYEERGQYLMTYAFGGLSMGLAFQAKIYTAPLIIPFVLSHIFSRHGNQSLYNRMMSKGMYISVLSYILGLILGNPAILFAFGKFVASMCGMTDVYTKAANVVPTTEHIGFLQYLIFIYRDTGPLLFICIALGILGAIIRKEQRDILLLSFILPFYLLIGTSRFLVTPYYLISIVPLLFVLSSKLILNSIEKSKTLLQYKKCVLTVVCLLLLIHPAISISKHEVSLYGKNTRQIAKEWIENNIPFGSKILMDSGKSVNSFAPSIAENRVNLERILAKANENISKGIIVHAMVDKNALIYYELLLTTVPEKSYDITSTMFGLDVKTIDYYIANQYQYFIISKNMKKSRTNDFFAKRCPEVANFYKSLDVDKRIKLIKTIGPSQTNMGDTFYIYEVIT